MYFPPCSGKAFLITEAGARPGFGRGMGTRTPSFPPISVIDALAESSPANPSAVPNQLSATQNAFPENSRKNEKEVSSFYDSIDYY
jgi:hypothetical protein